MSRFLFAFLFLFSTEVVCAQRLQFPYDSDLLTKEFHRSRREALRALMPDSSVAVFFSNPERNRSNDVDFQFSQDPDLYYLCGCSEPDAMLLVFKEKIQIDSLYTNEILFLRESNPSRESWTGRRLGTAGARNLLGFRYAFENAKYADFPIEWKRFRKIYYTEPKDDIRDNKNDKGDLFSLIKHFREATEKLKTRDVYALKDLMAWLRSLKTPEELVLLRKAVMISCEAHAELMRRLDSSMTEYQAQAILEYGFKIRGAECPGYPTIAGAGENTCIVHYTENRRPLLKNDLLVVDAGAEYHGYTADITRTLPVSGVFSAEQKEIYNIVLEAQTAGIDACRKGLEFRAPHKAAYAVIARRLKALGIIADEKDAVRYFFHGTSHYLGLDVHDAGLYGKLQPFNVITVEPGIYIPEGSPCDKKWWNIGVRIEDDILITEGPPENLSSSLPRSIAEIEKLMKENSFFVIPRTVPK